MSAHLPLPGPLSIPSPTLHDVCASPYSFYDCANFPEALSGLLLFFVAAPCGHKVRQLTRRAARKSGSCSGGGPLDPEQISRQDHILCLLD